MKLTLKVGLSISLEAYENGRDKKVKGHLGFLLIVLPRNRDLEEVINLLVVDKTAQTLDNDYKLKRGSLDPGLINFCSIYHLKTKQNKTKH